MELLYLNKNDDNKANNKTYMSLYALCGSKFKHL